jgi:flagellar FliJ protein
MAFRFPLAAVLRIRESIEMREEHSLEKIQLEMARIAHQIEDLSAAIAKAYIAREQEMQQPVPASHLQMHIARMQAATEKRKALFGEFQALEQQRIKQLKVYQAAHRDRETLTDILNKQRNSYEHEQELAHQKQLDDVFVARRQRV